MTLRRWRFTVTEHWIITSFEGKRARMSFPWTINKLTRFKYLLVWADDQHSVSETPPQRQNLCIQGFLQRCSCMPEQRLIVHLYPHFHECLLLPLGYHQLCSPNFRHDGLSLSSAGGSTVCTKFARTEVKDYPCKSEHGCHKPGIQGQPKPFWKWWPLGRWSHVQTDMNLSMVSQEFQPSEGTVSKGVCQWPALLLTRGKSA